MDDTHTPSSEDRQRLQELYKTLDIGGRGDYNLIRYAQFRALGYDHAESMSKALER